jgi:hypothetical protein
MRGDRLGCERLHALTNDRASSPKNWLTATNTGVGRCWCMSELWAFLFTSFGAFIAVISVALLIGVVAVVWWNRKID